MRVPGIRTAGAIAGGALELGRRAEREARSQAADAARRATLTALDGLLASPVAGEAVDRILASRLAERAVERALDGRLMDAIIRDVVRNAVIERAVDAALDGDVLDHVIDRAVAAELPARLTTSEQAQEGLAAALESPGVERVVTQVLESRLADDAIARVVDLTLARLAESPGLWSLVDAVAQSPSVRAAIAEQGAGFADEVAGGVRERSRRADDRLEGAARRLLHWRRADEPDGSLPESAR